MTAVAAFQGLHALKDAPHSVVSREMRRAGVYMSVLLLVWIPNFSVNILAEMNPNMSLDIAMEIIVMLTGLRLHRSCVSILTHLLIKHSSSRFFQFYRLSLGLSEIPQMAESSPAYDILHLLRRPV